MEHDLHLPFGSLGLMKFILLLSFLTFGIHLNGQVSMKDPEELTDHTANARKINFWSIRTEVLDYMNGTYSIFFEKNFKDWVGVDVGLGITGKNHVYALVDNISFGSDNHSFFWSPSSSNPDFLLKENILVSSFDNTYDLGYAISLTPKIYFKADPTEGAYIGLNLTYKNFAISSPTLYSGKKSMNQTRLNTTINFGRKLPIGENSIIDVFTGFGLAFVNDTRNIYYTDNAGNRFDGTMTWSPVRFHCLLGFSFGFMSY